jgi:hypothetical protein
MLKVVSTVSACYPFTDRFEAVLDTPSLELVNPIFGKVIRVSQLTSF